ncbi:MAG: hypothetical protein QM493_08600 [Sulfurovum sp.]
MNRCTEIKAHIRMEERYEGLSLIFGDNAKLKEDILKAIDEVKAETGQTPFIFDKISNDRPDIQSIYLEFHDDIHREGGEFFTKILKKLDIDKCEKDI